MEKHFVLVHGACHGAWSWYKLKPLLESAGHRVTAIDLAASGINTNKLEEICTFTEYAQPLIDFMGSLRGDEKVILVGHSFGGLSLALAMDKFPENVSVAVFLTAFMPDSSHQPSYVIDQYFEKTPAGWMLDTQFSVIDHGLQGSVTSMFFGPKFILDKLYQLSPLQDLTLGKMLIRPASLFQEDLSKATKFSKEGYGSVIRVYIVCKEDQAIPKGFQQWMIENNPVKEVMEIESADHMPMFSKPQELCNCLLEIAQTHS